MISVKKIDNDIMLKEAFAIRQKVFVIEQEVDPAEEYDEYENTSTHFLAYSNDAPAGTARYRTTENGIKLERFAVLEEMRGLGVGEALVKTVVAEVKNKAPKIYLHAQWHVIPFYAKFGFIAEGPEFEEANIRHRKMTLG